MTMLDLKYRPRKFAEVLGNDGVKKLLLTRSSAGTLANQSMMFGGPKGCGKTTLARLVARAIMCTALEEGEPCGECAMCFSILNETCQAVQEMDAASQGTVDRIRSMVHDTDYETMDGGDVHVYLIDEAQRLSKAAQDALLKAIEERLLVVMLCTTEPHKIQGPIRDRMEEYPVSAPPAEILVRRMTEICGLEDMPCEAEALDVLVRMNGSTPRSSYLSLSSVAALGPVTGDSVRQFFRFDSYELVDKILCLLDFEPVVAFQHLDRLSSHESPSWIRDTIVQAISSGLREEVGARLTYPVPTHFFKVRGRRWCDMAIILGSVDRPSMADIEAILLSDSPSVSVTASPAPVVSRPVEPLAPPPSAPLEPRPDPPEPVEKPPEPRPEPSEPVEKPPEPVEKPPAKEIDVDGIRFSVDETLTSLDDKVGKNRKQEPVSDPDVVEVGLDQAKTPISEKQFVSGFLSRFKGSG